MAHSRERWLFRRILADLKWSPVVGLFGLRQVGKTTLVESVARKLGANYVTFDREAELESSRLAPREYCSRRPLLCIDEAQKGAWIFPVIKDLVGTARRPGRFLLTGSVRFTSKQNIRESLTGRILTHELLPFSLAEARHLEPSCFLQDTLRSLKPGASTPLTHTIERIVQKTRHFTQPEIQRYMTTGGLPVPLFTRDPARRNAWFASYFETLVTRDVGLVDSKLSRIPLRQGLAFLRALALLQGDEGTLTLLSQQSGLRPTQSRLLLAALETLCVIDLIPPEPVGKKAVKRLRIEWKDVGLRNQALGITSGFGDVEIELLLSQELRSQISFLPTPTQWLHYRSRDGAKIPWIFRSGKRVVAATYIGAESPDPFATRAIRRFAESTPGALGIVFGSGHAPAVVLGRNVILVPYTVVL